MTNTGQVFVAHLLESISGALSLVVVLHYTISHRSFLTLINLSASPGR